MTTKPKLEERTEQPYVFVPIKVTLKEWGKANALVGELFTWLGQKGIPPAGAPFFRYWIIGDLKREFDLEVGVPVDEPVTGDGRVKAGSIHAGKYLVHHHRGHPDQLHRVHDQLQAWAADHAVAFKMLGANGAWAGRYESFLTNPVEQPDPNQWTTEVMYQVKDDTVC